MTQLENIKAKLDHTKTQRAIEQNKFDETMATLKKDHNIDTIEQAEAEYESITKGVIPNLILRRDNTLNKAQEIMNGIDTQSANGQGQATVGENTEGPAGESNARGTPKSRQIVGRKR